MQYNIKHEIMKVKTKAIIKNISRYFDFNA